MACTKNFTSEADFDPSRTFTDYPPYVCPPDNLTGYEGKATAIMNELLLTQYQNSPNLKEYLGAFVSEMDTLMEEIHKVELGRYIANATGAQLDVIGIILQQSRNLNVPQIWFGFLGASPIDGMADETLPSAGGVFRSEDEEGYTLTPLTDSVYRNVLLGRAFTLSQPYFSIDIIYEAIEIILGNIPSHIKLVEIAERNFILELDSNNITTYEQGILLAVSHWFIPMTITFNITLV